MINRLANDCDYVLTHAEGLWDDLRVADLDHVLAHTKDLWDDLRGARLFITGGTGFFGCWLLESLLWADEQLGLGASAVVLTRSPAAFARKAPHLAGHPAIQLHEGDVRGFTYPSGPFSHVIHAATEASATLNAEAPLRMFDTIVEGTWRVLALARRVGARKFLFTSSGGGLRPATARTVARRRGIPRGARPDRPSFGLWRGEACSGAPLRPGAPRSGPRGGDRPLLRLRGSVPTAGQPLCGRQLHPRRAVRGTDPHQGATARPTAPTCTRPT